MKDCGPRTEALVSFCHDLDQAFLLAKLLSRSGKAEVTQLIAEARELQQNAAEFDMAKATGFAKAADKYLRLGKETTPNVLFLFLMTKFEAYLEDIAVLICQDSPQLIGLRTASLEEETRQKINTLFFQKRLDQIGAIFKTQLNIPFADICNAADGCTPYELDKAKAIRNIHVHGRGRINARFRNRIGDQSLRDGEYYPITTEYLNDLKDKICLLSWGLDIWATASYPKLQRSTEDISPDDWSS